MLASPTNLIPASEEDAYVLARKIADRSVRESQAGLWLSITHQHLHLASSPFPVLLERTLFNAAHVICGVLV